MKNEQIKLIQIVGTYNVKQSMYNEDMLYYTCELFASINTVIHYIGRKHFTASCYSSFIDEVQIECCWFFGKRSKSDFETIFTNLVYQKPTENHI